MNKWTFIDGTWTCSYKEFAEYLDANYKSNCNNIVHCPNCNSGLNITNIGTVDNENGKYLQCKGCETLLSIV
jgi:formate dehydrogenase maturation protein FdhE